MLLEKPINNTWLGKNPNIDKSIVNLEKALFFLALLLAIFTRFYHLGDRPLSHDESIHLYYSYLFADGQGYAHTPLSHGPLQFHLIALLFFLFGSSDFIGRIPHAVSSILTIIMLWRWRKYLGRTGTLVTSLLMVISPLMLYYGRYARNEPIVILLGLITLFSILRYLETKKAVYLSIYTAATALHFTVKETAFIYVAQSLFFLFFLLILNVNQNQWIHKKFRYWFVIFTCAAIIILIPSLIIDSQIRTILLIIGFLCICVAVLFLFIGYEWKKVLHHPAFDILILTGTFVLPLLTAFPVTWLGWNPLDYQFAWPGWIFNKIIVQAPVKTGLVFILLVICSSAVGIIWGKKKWLLYGAIFWAIYIFFFTSIFSNPLGFFTGSIGSLGYWIEQQSVQRGNQPFYYYLLVQLPTYEFLPLLGMIPAFYYGLKTKSTPSPTPGITSITNQSSEVQYIFPLLAWWCISSLIAYSVAGEKMPWLTVHICFPMILLTGWGLGRLVDSLRFGWIHAGNKKLLFLATSILVISVLGLTSTALGLLPSGSGLKGGQQFTSPPTLSIYWLITFITALGYLIYCVISGTQWKTIVKLLTVFFFLVLIVQTSRTSIRGAFDNSGNANEYLVYAHGSDGITKGLSVINDISRRVSGGFNDITVAYDAGGDTQGTSWPLKWYMRNFSRSTAFYTVDNTILDAEVIIADPKSYEELNQILEGQYFHVDTLRIVWPNQDYFNLTNLHINTTIAEQKGRNALFQVWYNRKYSLYSDYYNKSDMVPSLWSPSDPMRIYIKKDLINKMWEYNIIP